jgi:hypothetical protein
VDNNSANDLIACSCFSLGVALATHRPIQQLTTTHFNFKITQLIKELTQLYSLISKVTSSTAHVHSSSTLALRLLPTKIPSKFSRLHTFTRFHYRMSYGYRETTKERGKNFLIILILVLGFFPFFKMSDTFRFFFFKALRFHVLNLARVCLGYGISVNYSLCLRWTCLINSNSSSILIFKF